ncbi:helix-turn-helix domain-containing protein [Paenibacillus sp. ACRSA]|uniref:helix-turn-helix domain-containing protein n=1 Tax=Paenibacillus sp. ACRSA TaxID=2918211 RepID=UPI001EF4FAD3|nr:helix-turn-helix transcriptional regulator [Paenibacillus sp. ACRSA]MCG7378410.1 helix-turn-helix domain-containing protein [Paenibacillus sp. ACRSA]
MQSNTIRTEVLQYIQDHNLTQSEFSTRANINSGSFSRLINQNKPFSMSQLDGITKAMGLEEDYFYPRFVVECFTLTAPDWRRLRPFLIRCAEVGRPDCIELILSNLLDNTNYGSLLFEVAEELFHSQYKEAAKLIYESVSVIEKYQHSERLALCQYRLFSLSLSDNLALNLRAATRFEPYANRLEETDQLEAIKHLAHVYVSLHEWHKVDTLSEEMYRLASIQYELSLHPKRKTSEYKRPFRPFYFYMLYARLLQSAVYEQYEDYEKAIEYTLLYTNADVWIQDSSDEASLIIKQFNDFSTVNLFLYQLLAGNLETLTDYVEYISRQPDEIFHALTNIVKVANKFDINIDDILDRFQEHIPFKTYNSEFGEYNKPIKAEEYSSFLADLGKYRLHQGHSQGIDILLEGLEFAGKINSESNIIKCLTLFNRYREWANYDQLQKFNNLNSEVYQSHEKYPFSSVY